MSSIDHMKRYQECEKADDNLVDFTSKFMRSKMRSARHKGRGGWHHAAEFPVDALIPRLVECLTKGEMINAINYLAMATYHGPDYVNAVKAHFQELIESAQPQQVTNNISIHLPEDFELSKCGDLLHVKAGSIKIDAETCTMTGTVKMDPGLMPQVTGSFSLTPEQREEWDRLVNENGNGRYVILHPSDEAPFHGTMSVPEEIIGVRTERKRDGSIFHGFPSGEWTNQNQAKAANTWSRIYSAIEESVERSVGKDPHVNWPKWKGNTEAALAMYTAILEATKRASLRGVLFQSIDQVFAHRQELHMAMKQALSAFMKDGLGDWAPYDYPNWPGTANIAEGALRSILNLGKTTK